MSGALFFASVRSITRRQSDYSGKQKNKRDADLYDAASLKYL